MSDYIDFEDVQVDESEQADVSRTIKRISSLNAKAVMPDGSTMSRGQILSALGLNPGTSPTAWLTTCCSQSADRCLKSYYRCVHETTIRYWGCFFERW